MHSIAFCRYNLLQNPTLIIGQYSATLLENQALFLSIEVTEKTPLASLK